MLKSFFHTGFVVRDIEESVKFYSEILGMRIAGRTERQGEFVEQVLAFPDAHIKGGFVDMGEGHQLELIQYISPHSGPNTIERNDLGAAHLAFFVEDLDKFFKDTRERACNTTIRPRRCSTRMATCPARPATPETLTETGWSSSNCSENRIPAWNLSTREPPCCC